MNKKLASQLVSGEIKKIEFDLKDGEELIETINLRYDKTDHVFILRCEIDFTENEDFQLSGDEKINMEFISNAITDIINSKYYNSITIFE